MNVLRLIYLESKVDWFLGRERALVERDGDSRVNSRLGASGTPGHDQLFTLQARDDRQLDIN